MVDIQSAAFTILSWLMWLVGAGGAAAILIGIIQMARGAPERGRTLFMTGLIAIVLTAFGWSLINAVTPPQIAAMPYGWVVYLMAGVLFVSGLFYLLMGRHEQAGWHIMASLLLGAIVMFGFAVAGLFGDSLGLGSVGLTSYGTLQIEIQSQEAIKPGDEVTFVVRYLGSSSPPITISIDFGDGSSSSGTINTVPGEIRFTHSYSKSGSYVVRVSSSDGNFNSISVVVQDPNALPDPGFPFNWFRGILVSLASGSLGFSFGIDLNKLVFSPLIVNGTPPWNLYTGVILPTSFAAFGFMLVLALIMAFWHTEAGEAWIRVFKDAAFVIAVAITAPFVYNLTVAVINIISGIIIKPVWDLAQIPFAMALAWVIGGIAVSFFVPGLGTLAGAIGLILLTAFVLVELRYFLIMVLITAAPLLAVLYLHPAFRGIVHTALSILAGLVLAGPLAAIFIRLFMDMGGMAVLAGTLGLAAPIFYAILPNILGLMGAGAMAQLGGVAGGAASMGAGFGVAGAQTVGAAGRRFFGRGGGAGGTIAASTAGAAGGAGTAAGTAGTGRIGNPYIAQLANNARPIPTGEKPRFGELNPMATARPQQTQARLNRPQTARPAEAGVRTETRPRAQPRRSDTQVSRISRGSYAGSPAAYINPAAPEGGGGTAPSDDHYRLMWEHMNYDAVRPQEVKQEAAKVTQPAPTPEKPAPEVRPEAKPEASLPPAPPAPQTQRAPAERKPEIQAVFPAAPARDKAIEVRKFRYSASLRPKIYRTGPRIEKHIARIGPGKAELKSLVSRESGLRVEEFKGDIYDRALLTGYAADETHRRLKTTAGKRDVVGLTKHEKKMIETSIEEKYKPQLGILHVLEPERAKEVAKLIEKEKRSIKFGIYKEQFKQASRRVAREFAKGFTTGKPMATVKEEKPTEPGEVHVEMPHGSIHTTAEEQKPREMRRKKKQPSIL